MNVYYLQYIDDKSGINMNKYSNDLLLGCLRHFSSKTNFWWSILPNPGEPIELRTPGAVGAPQFLQQKMFTVASLDDVISGHIHRKRGAFQLWRLCLAWYGQSSFSKYTSGGMKNWRNKHRGETTTQSRFQKLCWEDGEGCLILIWTIMHQPDSRLKLPYTFALVVLIRDDIRQALVQFQTKLLPFAPAASCLTVFEDWRCGSSNIPRT